MKAFFGAIVLTLMSAVAGVMVATELHQLTVAAGGSGAVLQSDTADATTEPDSEQVRQRVHYSVPRDVPPSWSSTAGI
ncbi:MAG: hypothetical protein PHS32_19250 [Rhodoferax sp.]|uniref:hypothetical protein n=1 Tax=Rhodoferax sp. TaxID=50421 RepID=UPI002635FAC6|nr:hypothetical protein [Rhodoferax sp.]MDD5335876.1 hypothetical protein [Rhodoferax sp.]